MVLNLKLIEMKTAIEQMMVDLEESLFGDSKLTTKEIWDKALEAEKQQIVEAYKIGDKYKTEISGEDYYNKTFKK
jgi:hypothetical protein